MKHEQLILVFILLLTPIVIAETMSGTSSSYTFDVENCTSPQENLTLSCNQTTVRFQCDFTNAQFIDYVEFRVNGVDYATTQNSTNPTQFYLTLTKPLEHISSTEPYVMDRQQVIDVDSNTLNGFQYLAISHNCTACPVTFSASPIEACQLNNTQTIQYLSSNESCNPSYNASQTCDYCTPYIVTNTTQCINRTQEVSYIDLNYDACCLLTGEYYDCIIDTYPYNNITNQTCQEYQTNFTCNGDQTPVLNDKMNLNCQMPDTENYCCVVNVLQNGNMLATTPEYKNPTQGILSIGKESETRTCFTPENRMLNAYYTNKELRPDTLYKIQVTCISANQSIISEYPITPTYHTPDEAVHWFVWAGNNSTYLIALAFVAIIVIALAILVVKKMR